MSDSIPPIEHSTFIRARPRQVYAALSTGSGWDAWFTRGTRIDARPGGEIRLRWESWGPDHITAEDGGPVLEALPGRRLVFQWQPGDTPTTVTIDLQQRGEGTLVRLTETGYASLAGYSACAAGWGEALTLLKFYLEHGLVYGQVP